MALGVETTTTLRGLGARTARDIPPLEQEGELTGRVEGFNLMMLQAALESIKTQERA